MTYQEAKNIRDQNEAKMSECEKVLGGFDSLGNGLTPDHVRALPEWQAAKRAADVAFHNLREHNGWMVKTFKKEMAAERKEKYKAMEKMPK